MNSGCPACAGAMPPEQMGRPLQAAHAEHLVTDVDRGMSTPLDWLAAASDPRVVAVDRARVILQGPLMSHTAQAVRLMLHRAGVTATEDQARALLDAVAAWDADQARGQDDDLREMFRDNLEDAVTVIVGEQP